MLSMRNRRYPVHQALSLGLKLLSKHEPMTEQINGCTRAYTVTLKADTGRSKLIRSEKCWLIIWDKWDKKSKNNNKDSA